MIHCSCIWTIYYAPGPNDARRYCILDVIFTKRRKGAIVQLRNYERTPLGKRDVDKIFKDMLALEKTRNYTEVSHLYMYLHV